MKEVEALEKLDKHERIVQYIRHDVISNDRMCFLIIAYSAIKYHDFEKENLTLSSLTSTFGYFK